MPVSNHKNFAISTLASPPSGTGGTSLTVASGHGALFPTAPFNVTVWPAGVQPTSSNAEIMRVTNKASDVFTVTRAQEGTSARTFSANDQIAATITARTLTDVEYGAHEVVNVKDPVYGAVGDGSVDDTTAIQAAIDAAGAYGQVIFPDGIYRCVGLTNTHVGQRWLGYGLAQLKKNGNGVILTGSAREQEYHNISFDGESGSYTGNNVNLTGDGPLLFNCSSYDAAGRAVLATGNSVQIVGQNGIYETTDSSATGYDIEIGVSGTATLYHRLTGFKTSQADGGLKFIDCGSQIVSGCQFGKYTVAAGTSPAGVNGGVLMGSRCLGTITIDLSNSVLVGNQFSTQAINYASGTSGHEYWANVDAGGVITNAGNASAAIIRQIGTSGDIELKFGDDTSAAVMTVEPDAGGAFAFPTLRLPNNKYLTLRNAADSAAAGSIGATAANNIAIAASIEALQLSAIAGKKVQFVNGFTVKASVSEDGLELNDAATAVGAGIVALGNGTQTTVGAAGAASALPANPTGYLRFYLGSTQYVIPYYAQA